MLKLVLAALLCIVGSGAQAQPAPEVIAKLPEQLAGFRRNGPIMPDPTPGMADGAIQRFSAGHSQATVYLFARTRDLVPDGPNSRAVQDEYTDSIGSVLARLGLERGGGQIRFERETTLNVQGGPALRCGLVRQTSAAGLQTDFVCVTGALGRLLKLRVTARHREDETPAMMTVVGHFIGTVTRTDVQEFSRAKSGAA